MQSPLVTLAAACVASGCVAWNAATTDQAYTIQVTAASCWDADFTDFYGPGTHAACAFGSFVVRGDATVHIRSDDGGGFDVVVLGVRTERHDAPDPVGGELRFRIVEELTGFRVEAA